MKKSELEALGFMGSENGVRQKQAGYKSSLPEIFYFIAVNYRLKTAVLLLTKSLLTLFGNGNRLRLKLTATFLDKSYHEKGIK